MAGVAERAGGGECGSGCGCVRATEGSHDVGCLECWARPPVGGVVGDEGVDARSRRRRGTLRVGAGKKAAGTEGEKVESVGEAGVVCEQHGKAVGLRTKRARDRTQP